MTRLTGFLMTGVSPFLLLLLGAPAALAQSSATQAVEDTVTVSAQANGSGGIMAPVSVPKQRSVITQEFIDRQPAGQSIFETLNKVPGFNFTNNDPYGNSGGNIRIHGYDGNHISFTWDGMPLNDTGNYAIYTNQVADSEIIGRATVNQGTTDVDSPTAAATGGVVAITTARPKDEWGVLADISAGSHNYRRAFLRLDSGAFGPWNTVAFATFSLTDYDKFKGPGHLQKKQFNASLYQDLGDLGWVQLAMHFNSNRNHFYNNPTFYPAVSTLTPTATPGVFNGVTNFPRVPGGPAAPAVAISPTGRYTGTGLTSNPLGFGLEFDQAPTCTRVAPVTGTAQSDASCSSFYGVRINPSDTGNIRISSLLRLSDTLSLTVDPSIQYVLANGGGYTALREQDGKLYGNVPGVIGRDLNGDGDILDTVGVYSPNTTNTIRYGLNTSLVWQVDANHTLQLAYTGDFGLHRQTGQFAFLDANGFPFDPFAGYRDPANRVLSADGTPVRGRDRRSRAILHQMAFAYEGSFFEDVAHVSAGLRMPFMQRDLNQLCYLQVTGSSGVGFPTCTTAAPTSAPGANGAVTLPGAGTNLYVPPAQKTVHFSRVMPNVGLSLSPWGPEHQFYTAVAAGLAAPRTDNLYNGGNNGLCVTAGVSTPNAPGCVYSSFSSVKPETSTNYSIGYRYNSDDFTFSISAYNNQFKNRIVTSFDQEQGISIDRNIGSVNVNGVDVESNVSPMENLNIYSSLSYIHTRVSAGPQAIILVGAGGAPVNLAGKRVAETPAWTFSQRYEYDWEGFTFGFGGKFVSSRYATDANDLKVPKYFLADADIGYDLAGLGWAGSYVKLNGFNLFRERYFGSISSRPCFNPNLPTSSACGSYPSVTVGAPQTFQFTLRTEL
jgi:iron complex outermembrane receptor protein